MVKAQNNHARPTAGLAPHVRSMVLNITDRLVQEGYRREKALLIAVGQAETWASSHLLRNETTTPISNYHVTPHPSGWVVRQPNSTQPCLIFKTRDEAVELGQALAQDLHGNLIIHKDSGEIQSKVSYQ